MNEARDILVGSYDAVTVTLSVLTAVLASYIALDLARTMAQERGRARLHWLAAGALVMGLGIWAMHFLGMLAYRLPVPVRYHLGITLLSILPSVLASALALRVAGGQHLRPGPWIGAGLLMGAAIGSMHYLGMAAMRMPAHMTYAPGLFALSLLIAVLASLIALHLAFRLSGAGLPAPPARRAGAALLMGVAISGMHYTGMAAMTVTAIPGASVDLAGAVDLDDLHGIFAGATLGLLGLILLRPSRGPNRAHVFGLSGRVALVTVTMVAGAALSVGFVTYHKTRDLLIHQQIEALTEETAGEAAALKTLLEGLGRDVAFLSRLPVLRRLIAELRPTGDPSDWVGDPELWRERLALLLGEFLTSRPDYAQARLVGVDDGGRELVRVERTAAGVIVTPADRLQRKGEEPYFAPALATPPGQIYLSPVSANREYGDVVVPVVMVIRAAVPVADATGTPFGFLVVNLDLTEVLARLAESSGPEDREYVTDQDGVILAAGEPGRRFRFDPERRGYLQDLYPGLKTIYATPDRPAALVKLADPSGRIMAFHLRRVALSSDSPKRHIAILESVPYSEIEHQARPVLVRLLAVTLLVATVSALLALWLVRKLLRPLQELTRAAERLAGGDGTPTIPAGLYGEIGVLSDAFRDMTTQVGAREAALRVSEERLRLVLANVADAIVTIDERGIIQSFNTAAERIFLHRADDAIGRNVSLLMPEPHRSGHDGYLRRHLAEGHTAIIGRTRELTGLRGDGAVFPLELTVTGVREGGRRLFIGLMRDLSGRRLAQSEQRLAAMVMESAQESIVITDADATICAVNPAFTETTGYSADEALGRNPRFLASGRHDSAFYRRMWERIRRTGTWQGEIWDRRKNGEVYPKWLTVTAIRDEQGTLTHYVGISSDITERKLSEQRLERLAHYDPLTQLPNRLLFHDRLGHAIAQAARTGRRLGLMLLDLNRFKAVNDTHGHDVGDALLAGVAERLLGCLRKGDTVARLGGDEFTILLPEVSDAAGARRVAEQAIAELSRPFLIRGRHCDIGVSIGIALYPEDGQDAGTLAKRADIAMYRAKSAAGNHIAYYQTSEQGDSESSPAGAGGSG